VETIKEISSWEPSSAAPNGVGNSDWVFSWMTDYLISVRDLDVKGINAVNEKGLFGESLPRVIGFCLEVLQHRRFSAGFRAKVLDAGIKVSSLKTCGARLRGRLIWRNRLSIRSISI
jgi:hypothetical protein